MNTHVPEVEIRELVQREPGRYYWARIHFNGVGHMKILQKIDDENYQEIFTGAVFHVNSINELRLYTLRR